MGHCWIWCGRESRSLLRPRGVLFSRDHDRSGRTTRLRFRLPTDIRSLREAEPDGCPHVAAVRGSRTGDARANRDMKQDGAIEGHGRRDFWATMRPPPKGRTERTAKNRSGHFARLPCFSGSTTHRGSRGPIDLPRTVTAVAAVRWICSRRFLRCSTVWLPAYPHCRWGHDLSLPLLRVPDCLKENNMAFLGSDTTTISCRAGRCADFSLYSPPAAEKHSARPGLDPEPELPVPVESKEPGSCTSPPNG